LKIRVSVVRFRQATKKINNLAIIFVVSGLAQGFGLVAQLVEQRIENPRVGGSIPPQATSLILAQGSRKGHHGGRLCVLAS
jgi:hypothetical protein